VLHRNSAYRSRRAALVSSHDTSGATDNCPVLAQSCRTRSVRIVIFLAPTKSAWRRDILGRLIQSLVAFLGTACLAVCGILREACPHGFVGGTHLARHITGHLGRQTIEQAYLVVAVPLQGPSTADLAVLKGIARDMVQGIPICQLRLPQCLELLRSRMQFQFGRDDLFHGSSIAGVHSLCQDGIVREVRQFLPTA
jgi:hypothetical protein